MRLVSSKKVLGIVNCLARHRCYLLVSPMALKRLQRLRYDISMGRIVVHQRLRMTGNVRQGIFCIFPLQQSSEGRMGNQLRNTNAKNRVLRIGFYDFVSPLAQRFGSYGTCLVLPHQALNGRTSLIQGIRNFCSLGLVAFCEIISLYYDSCAQ